MNGLQAVLTHPATARLGWTLLHFLWQGAAIAVVLGIGLLALRRARANSLYVVACIALLLMVAAPIVTYSHLAPSAVAPLPSFTEPIELPGVETTEVAIVPSAPVEMPFTPMITDPLPMAPPPAPQPWHVRAMDWVEAHLNWIVGVWFCGVIVLSMRLLMGWIGVRRMRSSGAAASETMQKRLKRLAHRLRVTRTVRLLESAAAKTPVVMGWLRPVVLFPASLLTQLSAEQLDAVIAHELAHIRRHDYLVNLFQAVVETLLFYHPAVHWVSHRIRIEREHACDDLAVSACGNSTSYAHALARLAEMNAVGPRLLPGASGHLFARIKRLLHVDTPRDKRASMWIGGVLLLVVLSVCAVALGSSKAPEEKTDESREESRESETPPDYSAMFEMIDMDEGMRMPTPEEIRKLGPLWPTVPPEENAAYWLVKASTDLIESRKQYPEPAGSFSLQEAPYAGDAEGFVQYIQMNRGVLTTVKNGMLPGRMFSLPHLISMQFGTPVTPASQLAKLRNLARFFTDTGFAAELQGMPDAAVEQYLLCMRMGKLIQQDAVLITHLVGIAVDSIGIRQLDALLANTNLEDNTLRSIIARAQDMDISKETRLAVLQREADFARATMALSPQQARVYGKDYDEYAEYMEEEFSKPLPELLRSLEDIAKEVKARYPRQAMAAEPLLESLSQNWARTILRLRVIQIRAAIALYKMEHDGEPPLKLESLTPEYLPKESLVDPFSGDNLKYVGTISDPHAWRWPTAADMGWKLWSVGPDLKDDGGTAADVDQDGWKGPDYVFTDKVRSNIDRRSDGKIKTLPTPKPLEQISSGKLQLRLVDETHPKRGEPLKNPQSGETIYLLPEVLMTEADIASASIQKGERDEKPVLRFRLTPDGSATFEKITEENIGRRLAIVYEGEVVSAPTIKSRISGAGTIQGSDEKELRRIAELINSQKSKPAPTADESPSFGPVIERVVNHSGESCLIDFETGELFHGSLPPGIAEKGKDALDKWLAEKGIDAGGSTQPEIMGLIGFDLCISPQPNERWETLTASNLMANEKGFATMKPGNPIFLSTRGDVPATWIFKTREGGLGILQILGFTDIPKGLKIRYKMVQQARDKAKSGGPITRDIMFGSEERTETGAICKWEVPAGAPVRLLTAWLILEDGQLKETTGPGGRQTADQSYPMQVEWEWSVEDFKLWVSRGVRRFEDDSTNTSRVKAPTAWPRSATFQSKAFTEPAVLSDEPTILWRGDWMRDDNIVKSVIFVAYAVGDDVSPDLAAAAEAAEVP